MIYLTVLENSMGKSSISMEYIYIWYLPHLYKWNIYGIYYIYGIYLIYIWIYLLKMVFFSMFGTSV